MRITLWMCALALMGLASPALADGAREHEGNREPVKVAQNVTLMRAPNGGKMPQVAVADGVVHMTYYKGEKKKGDLFYVRATEGEWSKPVRINSQDGAACAMGLNKLAGIALGKGGTVHVVWGGSPSAEPRPATGAPLLYARLNGETFSKQRNLLQEAGWMAGASIAADGKGKVYVTFHGSTSAERPKKASQRRMMLLSSSDDGKSWSEAEQEIEPQQGLGACGCCGVNSMVDSDGTLYVMYRTMIKPAWRDARVLVRKTGAKRFTGKTIMQWRNVHCCPSSTADMTQAPKNRLFFAVEQGYQVYLAAGKKGSTRTTRPAGPQGKAVKGRRQHPRVAFNDKGESIVVWTEAGTQVCWQRYNAKGRPVGRQGRRRGLPKWDCATVYAAADGSFVILY